MEYKIPITQITHEFGASKPTVQRWADGVNVPMIQLRPIVLEKVLKMIEEA